MIELLLPQRSFVFPPYNPVRLATDPHSQRQKALGL
jgi:hypothetical protein